jgi:hypothetical protein
MDPTTVRVQQQHLNVADLRDWDTRVALATLEELTISGSS